MARRVETKAGLVYPRTSRQLHLTSRAAWAVLIKERRGLVLFCALTLALLARLLVGVVGLPSIASFVFFPLLLGLILSLRASATMVGLAFMRMLVLFSVLVGASALVNGSSILATAVLWASLVVPFLVIAAIPKSWVLSKRIDLSFVIIGFMLLQGGLSLFEFFVLGRQGDAVQGLLSGQGAGHHVLGFIGAGTALYLGALLLDSPIRRGDRLIWIAAAVGGMAAVLSGTNQALLALAIVGVAYMVVRRLRPSFGALLVVSLALLAAVLGTWSALAPTERSWYGAEYWEYKSMTAAALAVEVQDRPESLPFGAGPGSTATRVAWIGGGDNLVGSLGIEPGSIASQLLEEERAKPPWRTSSLTSPWSTFLGVLGDLGVIGLLSYLSLWLWLATQLGKKQTGRPGVALICYLLVIGLFYNWLEEPVLTLFLALPLAHSLMQVETSDTRLARQ